MGNNHSHLANQILKKLIKSHRVVAAMEKLKIYQFLEFHMILLSFKIIQKEENKSRAEHIFYSTYLKI